MALKNAFQVTLVVPAKTGTRYEFDKFSGGKFTRSETKYTAADRVQRSYTGLSSIENLTLERVYQAARDGAGILAHDIRGLSAEVIIKDLNEAGEAQANRPPYIGKVLEVTPPDGDVNDASTTVMLGVTVSVENPTAEVPHPTEPVPGP